MFGLGMTEIILIAVVALVVVGPKRLPDIAKSIGKGYGEFRRSFGDLKQSMNFDDIDKPEKSSTSSPTQSKEERKQELIETYKSQWEQKLPTVEDNEKDVTLADKPETVTEKKDGGEESGK